MPFDHERLHAYQHSISFVAWSQQLASSLPKSEPARSQLDRASSSIPLNIAEGNAKSSARDRARYWRTALGSTFECAAVLDVLVARRLCELREVAEGKVELERIAAMLIGLLKNIGCSASE